MLEIQDYQHNIAQTYTSSKKNIDSKYQNLTTTISNASSQPNHFITQIKNKGLNTFDNLKNQLQNKKQQIYHETIQKKSKQITDTANKKKQELLDGLNTNVNNLKTNLIPQINKPIQNKKNDLIEGKDKIISDISNFKLQNIKQKLIPKANTSNYSQNINKQTQVLHNQILNPLKVRISNKQKNYLQHINQSQPVQKVNQQLDFIQHDFNHHINQIHQNSQLEQNDIVPELPSTNLQKLVSIPQQLGLQSRAMTPTFPTLISGTSFESKTFTSTTQNLKKISSMKNPQYQLKDPQIYKSISTQTLYNNNIAKVDSFQQPKRASGTVLIMQSPDSQRFLVNKNNLRPSQQFENKKQDVSCCDDQKFCCGCCYWCNRYCCCIF